MFINFNHLNEGSSVKISGEEHKKSLNEGENPRTESLKEFGNNRQSTLVQNHVNHNWEKLRKK